MVNERMYGLGAEPSAIRELFAYGMVRKAEIGAENVLDVYKRQLAGLSWEPIRAHGLGMCAAGRGATHAPAGRRLRSMESRL